MTPYEKRHAPTNLTYADKPYRTGQYIPGSVMFTHSPRRTAERWRPSPDAPQPTEYADELDPAEQAAWEAQIDANPHNSLTHQVYADWLQDRGHNDEAAFRRSLGDWFHIYTPDTPGNPHYPQEEYLPWRVPVGHYPNGVSTEYLPPHHNGGLRPDAPPHEARFVAGRYTWPTYRGMEQAFRHAFHARLKDPEFNRPPEQPDQNNLGVQPTEYDELDPTQPQPINPFPRFEVAPQQPLGPSPNWLEVRPPDMLPSTMPVSRPALPSSFPFEPPGESTYPLGPDDIEMVPQPTDPLGPGDIAMVQPPGPLPMPKDLLGRFIDNEMLDWARVDHEVREELRGIIVPEDWDLLEQHLAMDLPPEQRIPLNGAPTAAPPQPTAPASEHWDNWKPETAEQHALHTEPVTKTESVGRPSANQTALLTLANGQQGIFKPFAGERRLRNGIDAETYWRREVGASDVARILGFSDLVPPTSFREHGGKQGSLQQFVPNSPEAQTLPDHLMYDGDEDASRAAVFDYLLGNSDRHDGNWLVNNGKLVLIDNGLSFPHSVYFEDYFNHDFWDHAVQHQLPMPDVSGMVGKWPEVENALRAAGLEEEAIGLTRQRFDAITEGQYQAVGQLPAFWIDGSPLRDNL